MSGVQGQGQGQERSGLGAPARVSLGAPPGPWGQRPGRGHRAAGDPPSSGRESSGFGHSLELALGMPGKIQGPESRGVDCVGIQGLSLMVQGAAGVEMGRSGQRSTGGNESSSERCFIAVGGVRASAEQGADSLGMWSHERRDCHLPKGEQAVPGWGFSWGTGPSLPPGTREHSAPW